MSPRQEKRSIGLIIALFLLLGAVYALVTPAFEASDELWHYPMIRHLADGKPLPVQVFDPALAGPWKQEASQPPLYYYVGAALTFWIDTSDMETVRWLNPHVDNGVITTDGNVNLAVHDPAANPWRGTLLAVRIVRLVSVLMGGAAVLLTYLIARELLPERTDIALGAAALHAFTPMFLFISGAVNNDNLAIPLASLGILLLIRLVRRQGDRQRPVRALLILGTVIGLAVLTKQGTIGLLPLAAGTLVIWEWVSLRHRPLTWELLARVVGRAVVGLALVLLPVVIIAGWWYWRNVQLYGDLLGWNAFIAVLGQRETPASLAQLWDERWGFMLSYWGLFGGVNVPMWPWTYQVLNGFLIVSLPGGILFVWRQFRQGTAAAQERGKRTGKLLLNALQWLFNLVADRFALVICLLFSTAVIYGLIQWATTTWSSQGRLVFTAMSTLNVLWAAALAGWLPPRPARWVLAVPVGLLLALAALSPLLIIRPTYTPIVAQVEMSLAEGCSLAACLPPDKGIFGDGLRLAGYDLRPTVARPGGMVTVWLEWVSLDSPADAWSVFVHLNDPVLGVPIAQRDMYLGQGLVATSFLVPGQRVINRYDIVIPETAVTPADLELVVGLYEFESGRRLALKGGGEVISLEVLTLAAADGAWPNQTSVNFENRFELVGFELEPRRVAAGGTLQLQTYWHLSAPAAVDYTFFAQVVGQDTTRWAAVGIGRPTSTWEVGSVEPLSMVLEVDPDTPAGVYPLRIGIYSFSDSAGFDNLQRVTAEGRLTDDFLNLTVVRVDD